MKRLRIGACLLLLALLFVSCSPPAIPTVPEGIMQIYFLDVGQGDCILFRTSEGDVLVDTGTESSQELLCLRLEQLGVRELALMVISHPDEDHIGGADGVLERFPTREIWTSGAPMENESARRMVEAAEAGGTPICRVSPKNTFWLGDMHFWVMAPYGAHIPDDGNEGSIILKAFFHEVSVLLTGDAGVEQERELVSFYAKGHIDCNLYKVGHHGSNTSSSEELLAAMSPQYAVISCGRGNSYGHPFGEVLARLEASGAEVLRTDLLGEIVFETDGKVLWRLSSEEEEMK